MSYGTDRKRSPTTHPDLYRAATVEDILNTNVHGFYESNGSYWRKNGGVTTWKTCPNVCRHNGGYNPKTHVCTYHPNGHARVPVKYGLWGYSYVDHEIINQQFLWVRLGEVPRDG